MTQEEESWTNKYLLEQKEQKEQRELDIKNNKVLTEDDKTKIKELIKENFLLRGKDPESITDKFIKSEFSIVYRHISKKIKHSHHLDSLFDGEILSKIKSIIRNKIV